MAKREVTMNEIVEMIYQCHQGAEFKTIRRSLIVDRRTIRKYIHFAQMAAVTRDSLFPEESDLMARFKGGDDEFFRETP